MKQLTIRQAYNRAANLCSRAEKCKLDIINKLKTWGILSDDSKEIMLLLEKNNFIDEKRYVRSFVNEKVKINKWGRLKIRASLNNKKIPKEYINKELDNINNENYINTLKKLLEQKSKTIKETNNYKKNIKLIRYAAGRGFEQELIFKIINYNNNKNI